ncbi:hypothetical protein DW050_10890 [Ruminococcus sp. AF42-10]|nr:hypothetical protein DW050_10890 [Ruminococcus sp. AF42-10]
MFADPTGLCYEPQYTSAGTYIGKYWVIKTAVPGVPGFCNSCKSNGSNSGNKYYVESSKNNKNTKGDSNWTTRKDSKKGSENRQKSAIANVMLLIPTARNIVGVLKATE